MTCDACHTPITGTRWHYSGSPVVTCDRCHAEIVAGRGIAERLRELAGESSEQSGKS
jgi:hypothetical protein